MKTFKDLPKDIILYEIITRWRQNNIYETLKMFYKFIKMSNFHRERYNDFYIELKIDAYKLTIKRIGQNGTNYYSTKFLEIKELNKYLSFKNIFYKNNYKNLEDFMKKKKIIKIGKYFKLNLSEVRHEFYLNYTYRCMKKKIRQLIKRSNFDNIKLHKEIRRDYLWCDNI